MGLYSESKSTIASSAGTASVDIINGPIELPANPTSGQNVFDIVNNRIYIWTGTTWIFKDLTNEPPVVSNPPVSITLSQDGTPYILTLSATDPEGFIINWSYTSTDIGSQASISQSTNNQFIIIPQIVTDTQLNFTVTFTVSDKVNSVDYDINFITQPPLVELQEYYEVVQYRQLVTNTIDGCFEFSPDGAKLFLGTTGSGPEGDERIIEYSLSTAWDLSTATATGNSIDVDVVADNISIDDIIVNPEGTRMIISGAQTSTYNNRLVQFNLSTAWDLSTATRVDTYSLPNWGIRKGLGAMYIVPNGTQLWIAMYDNFGTHYIRRFGLPTAYTLSGITQNTSIAVAGSGSQNRPEMITFNHDGSEFAYTRGDGYTQVYDVTSPYQMLGTSPRIRDFFPTAVDYPLVLSGFRRVKFYQEGRRMFTGNTTMIELVNSNYSVIRTYVRDNGISSAYEFYGGDIVGDNNPTINMNLGDTLVLDMRAAGHPLWIKTEQSTGQANALDFLTNGREDGSTIYFKPDTVGTYYYNCEFHSAMNGQIIVS